jgi:hypothetical protein
MNARLKEHLAAGGKAEVETLTSAEIEIDGSVAPLDLTSKAGRLLVESAALVEAAARGTDHIENL